MSSASATDSGRLHLMPLLSLDPGDLACAESGEARTSRMPMTMTKIDLRIDMVTPLGCSAAAVGQFLHRPRRGVDVERCFTSSCICIGMSRGKIGVHHPESGLAARQELPAGTFRSRLPTGLRHDF